MPPDLHRKQNRTLLATAYSSLSNIKVWQHSFVSRRRIITERRNQEGTKTHSQGNNTPACDMISPPRSPWLG